MLVHAHPDDECIGNGATMARYVSEGAQVSLVTCTLGEEGEVLVGDLVHLAADASDELGQHRLGELSDAMAELGVTDFVRLGGDGHYRDSGMAYDDKGLAVARSELRAGIFWTADLLEAANLLVPLIRSRRPQVLLTYNEWGGYGHPDHVQAHRVAMYAYVLAGAPHYRPDLGEPWTIRRVLWNTMSASRMQDALRRLREAGDTKTFEGLENVSEMPPMMSEDSAIAVAIDGTPWIPQKLAAMKAHKTQITPDGFFFAAQPILGDTMWSHEFYVLAAGQPFPDQNAWTDDIFDGME